MGLLDSMQQAPQQPQGGLLGGMMGAGGGQPQQGDAGTAQGLQMAMQLAQNPTPQMAQQILAQMKQAGMPEVDQMTQVFAQAGDDPEALREIANAVIQGLRSQ